MNGAFDVIVQSFALLGSFVRLFAVLCCAVLCCAVQDEAIAKMSVDKLRKLKPFFRPQGGTITGSQG